MEGRTIKQIRFGANVYKDLQELLQSPDIEQYRSSKKGQWIEVEVLRRDDAFNVGKPGAIEID
jgi:hypothetical protein